ncbi:SOS response UmuD protein. Serine peptidase. MEROPS family S24 [Mucilaginibacter pineti]|uniref:SOS response UmuD protein. Serine peptidase. MEROPS family S24 n=1 Tax=Mucilaginibacter pineti TaxID=1391627 RepID=A0A1G6Z1S8_9SPHI|nr:S24 family peptidase [Mucilaginibacter pineti]SDD96609.1 SOS response UmuD protein. Serine peptidase. MEROPS family S24 [Mucilaginibacter pineti]
MLKIKKQATKRDVLGFRLPMLTHEEPTLDITDITVVDPDNTYYMRMGSEAMTAYRIGKDHILVIDRSLQPVPGNIVVFFHEGDFYIREYCPEKNRLVLKANSPAETLVIENAQRWTCWGVAMLSLNPLLQPQQRTGRYSRVCAC